jgi:hypothetical protein
MTERCGVCISTDGHITQCIGTSLVKRLKGIEGDGGCGDDAVDVLRLSGGLNDNLKHSASVIK